MREYTPNPIIVARAVHLWSATLKTPHYDNGDNSTQGALTQLLAHANNPTAPTDDAIGKFAGHLFDLLLLKRRYDHALKKYVPDDSGYCENSLHTDYHPEGLLVEAADVAGIKHSAFPWKSHTWIYDSHLSCRFGYTGSQQYHYPLDEAGSNWLVTSLNGEPDINAVIESVRNGNPLGLRVDAGVQLLANS